MKLLVGVACEALYDMYGEFASVYVLPLGSH